MPDAPLPPAAPAPGPEPAQAEEMMVLNEIKTMLAEAIQLLKGTSAGEVEKEAERKATKVVAVENADAKSKPASAGQAGSPQGSNSSTLQTETILNKELSELRKELDALKGLVGPSVGGARAPVDTGMSNSIQELRKENLTKLLTDPKYTGLLTFVFF